jgi:hypothetical protein
MLWLESFAAHGKGVNSVEWIGSLAASLVLLLLVIPVVVAVGTVFLLGAAGWISNSSPSLARIAFYCPFSRRRVCATFLTRAGEDSPADVVTCSRFKDERAITCDKGCTHLAASGWGASCMEPRFALLSGDVAYRPVAGVVK